MSDIGNKGARSSGVTGCNVPGCKTGEGGLGTSARMLYQARGISSSLSRYLVWMLSGMVCSYLQIQNGRVAITVCFTGRLVKRLCSFSQGYVKVIVLSVLFSAKR